MKRNIPVIVTLAIIIVALLAVAAVRKPKAPAPTTQEIWQKSGVPVQTAAVIRGDMDDTVQITGDLSALNSAVISPKISGRLMSINIREGDRVSRGEVVAVLDQGDAEDNLETAQASLESAKAKLEQAVTNLDVTKIQTQTAIRNAQASLKSAQNKLVLAKQPSRSQERRVAQNKVNSAKAELDQAEADYKRYERLLKRGSVSQSDYDVKKANYLVAKANYNSAVEDLSIIDEGGRKEDVNAAQSNVDVAQGELIDAKANAAQVRVKEKEVTAAKATVLQAKAAVDTARRELGNTYIKSPISGVVSSRSVDPGNVVSAGQELASIVDLNSVYFKGDVSEQYMAKISKGQSVSVRVDALPNDALEGTITEVYPSGSTSNRNFSVRISIAGASNKIKPGMFATGEVLAGRLCNILMVPKDAVNDQEGTQSVFVIGKDNIAKKHIISILKTDRNYAQVSLPTDLKVGDMVATQGRKNLKDGSKVERHDGGGASDVAN
ncbi:efflux RND transporter periplasmic adaptor subunit [bacterium]|nr:efflux RND transporter periplasmic adaptor subunit [bacterium]